MSTLKAYTIPLQMQTLGDWKIKPVSFHLNEGVSPCYGRTFPVPKIHKDTIIKEVESMYARGIGEAASI